MNEKTVSAIKSYVRHFIGACLAAFTATGGDIFTVDASGAKAIFTAGVVAVLPVLLRALDSSDSAFGREE
jgi:hypothetical protein